jgi:hypothetical protein
MSTSTTRQLRDQLIQDGVDPFQIAAEAVDRSNRLQEQVNRLEKVLSQVPELVTRGPHCSSSCLID